MSVRKKKRLNPGWLVLFILLPLIDLILFIRKHLLGKNVALFNPKGLIAHEQHSLMLVVVMVLLVIAIPAVFLLYFIAWKYRETNTKSTYNPNMHYGKRFKSMVWAIPTTVMLVLAAVMWPATHKLAPQKAIASTTPPLTIQVVSMRWKWLFIYPEQKIATLNFVQLPVNQPVQFELTADEAPMSSFWIPNLGGQLYSMTGMVNRLNLMPDTVGDYPGSSAELNGAGFSSMKFTARVSSLGNFDIWVGQVRHSLNVLDSAKYQSILKPSQNNPATFYSSYESGLYDAVLMKYMGPDGVHMHHQ